MVVRLLVAVTKAHQMQDGVKMDVVVVVVVPHMFVQVVRQLIRDSMAPK